MQRIDLYGNEILLCKLFFFKRLCVNEKVYIRNLIHKSTEYYE